MVYIFDECLRTLTSSFRSYNRFYIVAPRIVYGGEPQWFCFVYEVAIRCYRELVFPILEIEYIFEIKTKF